MSDHWSAVEEALDRGEWHEALTPLDRARRSEDPRALEWRARAAYAAGNLEACISSWERLHLLRLQLDDPVGAAVAAANAALFLLMDTGLMAPVRGWVSRARRAVAGTPGPTPAHALIAAVLTYERFLSGDADAASRHARDAVELGMVLGLPLPVAFGRVAQARLSVLAGEVAEGLGLLDEVGSTLLSGDVDELATGMLLCEMVCAAQSLGDHERAREWTTIMDAWRGRHGFGTVHGRCRLHRAELLRQSGPGDSAESEALAACEELRPWMRREYGWPLAELGTIRLRRGEHDGAADAFAAAEDHGWTPQPGSALLKLARGDGEAAAGEIARAITEPPSVPSKEHPPIGDLRLVPLLEAQVEIAAACGDAERATAAAEQLAEIARRFPNSGRDAAAALAAARVALLEDDAVLCRDHAQRAVDLYDRAEAVFEASCARAVLSQALARLGEADAAAGVWQAAADPAPTSAEPSRLLRGSDRWQRGGAALRGLGTAANGEQSFDVLVVGEAWRLPLHRYRKVDRFVFPLRSGGCRVGSSLGDESEQRADRHGRVGVSGLDGESLLEPLPHKCADFDVTALGGGAKPVDDRFGQT